MNKDEILKALAEWLDEKIKLRGILEMVDGAAFKFAIEQGYAKLEDFDIEAAEEFLQLGGELIEADNRGTVDEAADLLAALVKKLFYPESK